MAMKMVNNIKGMLHINLSGTIVVPLRLMRSIPLNLLMNYK